ncbi:hypothetical protein AN958_01832 [Leucoagaricus sp. SymC.cos]|nr:hypothetical protein AN958_01832 [Leucoagaricus sp. SymC.cos]
MAPVREEPEEEELEDDEPNPMAPVEKYAHLTEKLAAVTVASPTSPVQTPARRPLPQPPIQNPVQRERPALVPARGTRENLPTTSSAFGASTTTLPSLTITDSDAPLDPMALFRINALTGIAATMIKFFVQIWFAYRLEKLSQSTFFPRLCLAVCVIEFVLFSWNTLRFIVSILACVPDLLIAGGNIWCIWTRRKRRIFTNRTIVDKVLMWCLETNLLTCIFISASFTSYELSSTMVKVNYIWLPLGLVTCRLYSICLFASLIGKKRFEDKPQVYYADPELASGSSNDVNPLTRPAHVIGAP